MGTLILIRHGQSQWNLENRFAGWSDIPLTPQGERDAAQTAKVLTEYTFDRAFTSRLIRASQTLTIILKGLKQKPEIVADSALNERHYGDLQGLNKAETAEKYGKDQVHLWRRSFSTRPPNGESIEDCKKRTLPFFLQYILPDVVDGRTVVVVAHGNSLRPIIQYLDKLDNQAVAEIEVGLCTPYIYRFEADTVKGREVREVPGIVTRGASVTEKKVEGGRV